jgi:tetratricopeptide (TPR) repeat protein
VSQVAAATGLGGIGKTQLAVEFAHRYGRFFAGGVYWLSCSDPNAVPAEVVACGLRMGLPAFEDLDFPDQVRRVQQAWQEPIPRLLIFDNCEEEEVLAQWRPATGGCRVLVTSRRASWSAGLGVRSLALPVLPRAESVALLRRFRADLAADDPVLDAIADELGDLPLALHMAGSFLVRYRHDVTPATYLAQLRAPGLLAHRSLVLGDLSPTGHGTHVARTFALSYDQLDEADPVDALAVALLARLAQLAPREPVPRRLLLLALVEDAGESSEVDGDAGLASDALARLAELGLVDVELDGGAVLHRLLAAFLLDLPGAEQVQAIVEQAVLWEAGRLNNAGIPGPLLAWQAHLRYLADRAAPRRDERAAGLCNELGYHLQMIGDLAGARPYYEQALAITRQVPGEQHPSTAISLNNLGSLLQAQGDLAGARPYFEQALAITRQVLGEQHPDTAQSLNNLGGLLQAQGDLAGAQPYLEQALAIRRQVLGEQHPDTAQSLNNLGSLLQDRGDLAGAKAYLEQALAIRRQTLGEAHPDTATSLNNLGTLLQAMGDLPAARTYLEQALAIWRQALGEAHPLTATSLNNLGLLLQAMGDLPAAKSYLEHALVLRRQALGEAHPDTAAGLNNLGMLLQDMGDLPAAKPYYELALAIQRQALGEAHPHTAQSLNNLGTLLQAMGDLPAAKPYYEQALAIRRQALGEAHPDTAASLNNLGTLLQAMGDLPAAKPYLEQAVAIFEHSLGPNHPSTLTVRHNLEVLIDKLETAATPEAAPA